MDTQDDCPDHIDTTDERDYVSDDDALAGSWGEYQRIKQAWHEYLKRSE
jgi:hypothetical protein